MFLSRTVFHVVFSPKCSVNCGVGVRIRGVRCRYKRKTIADTLCNPKHKPDDIETCNGTKCYENYRWTTSSWQQVNVELLVPRIIEAFYIQN